MADATLRLKSDNLLVLENLKDELEDLKGNTAWVNNATVSVTLYDGKDEDTEISGQSWPVTMSYISGSDGTYAATLEDGLSVARGDLVWVTATADAGSDVIRKFTLFAKVVD